MQPKKVMNACHTGHSGYVCNACIGHAFIACHTDYAGVAYNACLAGHVGQTFPIFEV